MDGTIITKRGMQLLVKLMATKGTLTFTRVAIGTGSIPNGYDPASMIELVQYKMDGVISKCSAEEDVARITMQVSSVGIETGFIMTEMGVFASDPDIGEILYAYLDMKEDPQYIYAEGGETQKFVETTLEVAIEHATKVSTYINPSSLITKEDFDAEIEKIIIPEFDDSGEVTGITNFPAFLEKIKSKMNIFEFFKNLKAGLQFVLHTGQIVNNCVSDNPELPLSAAQGKILMDLINQTNGNLSNRFAINKQEFSTINDFPEYGSCFGVASQTLTLYEGFSIPAYSRIIFINYTDSKDAALIAVAYGGKTYTAFRNRNIWQDGKILISNTDLNPEVYIVPRPSDNSNFTFGNRTFQSYVRKSGKVVTIQLNISASMASVSDFVTAFTIPQKYNPLSDVIVNYTTQNANKPMILFITKNGEIKFSNFNTAIDDWLCRQCITYVTN